MKITRVDVLRVKAQVRNWTPILCRIYTDEGIYGDGEAALAFGNARRAAFGMVQDFAKSVIGMNPLVHEIIWDKLYRHSYWGQNGGPVIFAGISAIDLALWDIKGKAYHAPLYELLGGRRRESLRAYASQLQFGYGAPDIPIRTPEEYAREAKKAVADGYDCVKYDFFTYKPEGDPVKIGDRYSDNDRIGLLSPIYMNVLESRVRAVREAVGPNVDIVVENHAFTDAQSAVQIGNMLKQYRIFYYEEPTTPTPQLSKYVHEKTGLPIASGERIYSRWQYADYLTQNALQIIQPDLGTCGGITEVKKICDMAYVYDVGVQIHTCGSQISTTAALHLECAIPNFVIHEHNVWALTPSNRELCIYDYQPSNGKFTVPDLPGIGNEIAQETFAKSEVVTIE
ncbi:mandelate racemase/muconate lactonizing enzyme family protein [Feifania hominis]|uniref:Mandelate racemase/muconate lactonizing enzyme family protein n=1 Tax=Feifania hominis TaxID=2763660 RepID=A0A926DCD5_9FIRM|nr:mandelate racemase/muconate lactonizing enzyme family protein [Feifania hominis]MBC8535621.1 mandelate racemase/muconate lactonizing enzyme family protein [Feifania hominis]